jgi:hypothetical protein
MIDKNVGTSRRPRASGVAQVTADAPIAADPATVTARVLQGAKEETGERFTH